MPVQLLRYLSHRVQQEHRQELQRRLLTRRRDYQQAVLAAELVLQKVGVVRARHVHRRERQRYPGGDVQDHQQAHLGGGRRRSAVRAAVARPQAGGRGRDARGEVGMARRLGAADDPRQRAEVLIPLPRRRPRLVIRRVPAHAGSVPPDPITLAATVAAACRPVSENKTCAHNHQAQRKRNKTDAIGSEQSDHAHDGHDRYRKIKERVRLKKQETKDRRDVLGSEDRRRRQVRRAGAGPPRGVRRDAMTRVLVPGCSGRRGRLVRVCG